MWRPPLKNTQRELSFEFVTPLSPGQTDSQVDTSQHKFAKPELACGLGMGGQTDSQVGSQVAKSRKFHAYHWLMHFYNRLLAILCGMCPNSSLTKVSASPRKLSQVGGQTKCRLNPSSKLASTCESIWPGLYVSLDSSGFRSFLGFVKFISGSERVKTTCSPPSPCPALTPQFSSYLHWAR